MSRLDEAVAAASEIPGWMAEEELRWLGQRALSRRVIAEIGSWQGRSTKVMAMMTEGVVYAVDDLTGEDNSPVPDLDECFRRHLAEEIEADKVRVVRKPSVDAVRGYYPGFFDMVFIDGCHEYPAPAEDIEAWSRVIRDDGLLCGHDRWLPGVEKSLAECDFEPRGGAGSIWVR